MSASVTKKITKADYLKDTATYMTAGSVTTSTLADGAVTNAKLSTTSGELGGAWTDWTPTLIGFSSNPTGAVYRYKVIGKTCFIACRQTGNGTSNSTNFAMSLPYPAKSGLTNAEWSTLIPQAVNNGSLIFTAMGYISPGTSTVNFITTGAGAAWTASGGKRFNSFQMLYEID